MLLSWLPAANGRSIGPERLPHWSVSTARLIYAPFSGCSSWPKHRGVKFKLLLQPANSIRSRKDAQRWAILALFLVRGEGLPFAAHTVGVITLLYHRSPCLLHPAAIVMPDRVAVLSISAPRGQAISSSVPKRQAVRKTSKVASSLFSGLVRVLFYEFMSHPRNTICMLNLYTGSNIISEGWFYTFFYPIWGNY